MSVVLRMNTRVCCAAIVLVGTTAIERLASADWPMWRHDAARSADSSETLPERLHLQWVRHLPRLEPAYRNARLQFDAGYEPIVVGKTLLVGSSRDDRLTAVDTYADEEKWRFYTDGPIRLAPVAWEGRVYVGSDDGRLYCLSIDTGRSLWQFQAVPSHRKVLGNRRLISVWPVRGGPVLADGTVYFAAGVWPFEGVFVYALDTETGKVRWLNDRTSFLFAPQPHGTHALSGLTPQGYLVVQGEELIVPCGAGTPARFNRHTGQLIEFELPTKGRLPSGWFTAAARAQRRGRQPTPSEKQSHKAIGDKAKPADQTKPHDKANSESSTVDTASLVFDASIDRDRHEGGWEQGPGQPGARSQIYLSGRTFSFDQPPEGVTGTVHTMLAANGRLFVVTREGSLYCFAPFETESRILREPTAVLDKPPGKHTSAMVHQDDVAQLLRRAESRRGYALFWGLPDEGLAESLIAQSQMFVVVVIDDADRVARLRRRWDQRGWYGRRITIHTGNALEFGFPPYLANLIVVNGPDAVKNVLTSTGLRRLLATLRPFGGTACLIASESQHTVLEKLTTIAGQSDLSQAKLTREGRWSVLRREGPLPGTTNYTGNWRSPDKRVRAPLGVLWFDDSVSLFKRAPQPLIIDGVMMAYDKAWLGWPQGDRPPYRLTRPIYADVYTGRVLSDDEVQPLKQRFAPLAAALKPSNQYRPPGEEPWKPEQPVVGTRRNPLTGQTEPRRIRRYYGCDGGIDYGYLYTMRSGTGAFYDTRIESGTIHIGGVRTGCTNNLVPANGLLNVPAMIAGCTCSYPLLLGLTLVPMPETFEQWAVWGEATVRDVQRVGINFGAPGARATRSGTLWLEWPQRGEPSPAVAVRVHGKNGGPEFFYHHSVWTQGGHGWPWVWASGLRGEGRIVIGSLKPGRFTVRLCFAEPDKKTAKGERTFDVALQGRAVLTGFDIVGEAGGPMRGVVREFRDVTSDGTITLELRARRGQPVLCGVELITASINAGAIPTIDQRPSDWPF